MEPRGERVRRFAGAFVRRQRNDVLLLIAAGGGVLVGLWLGYLLHRATGAWLDGVWVSVGFGGTILVAVAAFWVVLAKLERGRLGRLEKGEDAEVRAGQFIEHALTAPDCAVAHSVTGIARIGDIDHLVATPVRLWVIETKYRRVPREHFPEVLRRIAGQYDRRVGVGSARDPGARVSGARIRIADPPQDVRLRQGSDRRSHSGLAGARATGRSQARAGA